MIKGNNSVVKINDCVLNRVNIIKYLGVIIDHKLKWCEHIAYVKNKVSKGLGIIFVILKFIFSYVIGDILASI